MKQHIKKLTTVEKSLSIHQQNNCLHMDLNHSYMFVVVLDLLSLSGTITQFLHYMYILEGSHGSLLSYPIAVHLGILDIKLHHISSTPMCDQLWRQCPSLFECFGKLKGVTVQLHIDTKVTLVAQKVRQIAFHLRIKIEHELKVLKEQHIIVRVTIPLHCYHHLYQSKEKWGSMYKCRDA